MGWEWPEPGWAGSSDLDELPRASWGVRDSAVLVPGRRGVGASPVPPPYDLCGEMAYCAPQVGVGPVPRGGLETLSLSGRGGSRGAEQLRGAPPRPLCRPAPPRLDKEKLEPNPEESQDIKASERPCQGPKAEQDHLRQVYGAHSGVLFERCSAKRLSAALRLCSLGFSQACKLVPCCRRWRKLTTMRICRRYARQTSAGRKEKADEYRELSERQPGACSAVPEAHLCSKLATSPSSSGWRKDGSWWFCNRARRAPTGQ